MSTRRDLALLILTCLGLAVLVRWPTSIYLDAIQLDPNTPLHALIGRELIGEGTAFALPRFEHPGGIPVRLIAWPVLLLSAPLNLLMSAIPALNVALLIRVLLQGLSVGLLLRAMGARIGGQLAGAAGVMVAPSAILALGNGQFENVAYLELALAAWAGMRGGRSGYLIGGLSVLGASFSSPYQGVVAALVLLCVSLLHDPKRVPGMIAASGAAFVPVYLYFSAVSRGQLHLYVAPAPGGRHEGAGLYDLIRPGPHLPVARRELLPGVAGRIEQLTATPYAQEYGLCWVWDEVSQASYIGLVLAVFGLLGLLKSRREPMARGLLLAGVTCLVMALGSTLHVASWAPTDIPLPWAISQYLPGISGMQATLRFLSGAVFALAVGVGLLLRGRGALLAVPVVVLLCLDGLLMAPARWPLLARAPRIDELTEHLDEGPVALWPSAPSIAPHNVIMFALLVDRPVSLFTGDAVQEEAVADRVATLHTINREGKSASEWLSEVRQADVGHFVRFEVRRDEPTCMDLTDIGRMINSDGVPEMLREQGFDRSYRLSRYTVWPLSPP